MDIKINKSLKERMNEMNIVEGKTMEETLANINNLFNFAMNQYNIAFRNYGICYKECKDIEFYIKFIPRHHKRWTKEISDQQEENKMKLKLRLVECKIETKETLKTVKFYLNEFHKISHIREDYLNYVNEENSKVIKMDCDDSISLSNSRKRKNHCMDKHE